MWIKFLSVAAGGAIGAMMRYAIHLFWVRHSSFPLGTLSANVLGCAGIGVLMYASLRRDWLGDSVRLIVVTGLLGSLTTFSTFGYETVEYAHQGKLPLALANVAANLALGLGAVVLGWGVAGAILGE